MITHDGFTQAWLYLRRNTIAREQIDQNEMECMTDAFEALSDFNDNLLMIAAQRHVKIGSQWFPTIGEWRRAGLAWLELGLDGAGTTGEAELKLMNGKGR